MAPSYFIEGLLLNVPQGKFGGTYAATVENTYTWISDNAPADYMCANGEHSLIRDNAQACCLACQSFCKDRLVLDPRSLLHGAVLHLSRANRLRTESASNARNYCHFFLF